MFVKFEDQQGRLVPVNVENVTFAGAAVDAKSGALAVGLSVIFFIGGTSCVVKGSTEEVYGILRRGDRPNLLNGASG